MSNQITTAFVQQFSSEVTILSQQRGSRLRRAVRVETVRGDRAFFDQISATDGIEVTSRHADSPLIETPHSRRMVTLNNWEWGDLIDDFDRVQTLIDPTNPYTMNAGMAAGRYIDDQIIAAFDADAKTGVSGGTTTSIDSGMQIDADFDGDSTDEGLTVAKLREARRLLTSREAIMDGDPIYIAVTSKQLDDLLGTTEVTSADFNSVKALVDGTVNRFLGFDFIRTERLNVAANVRTCPFWVQSGMMLAVGIEPRSRISERSDKRYSTYVYWAQRVGATRMDEDKVGTIACSEV